MSWKLKGQLVSSDFLGPIGVAIGPLIVRSSFLKAPEVLTRRQKLRNYAFMFVGFLLLEFFIILPKLYGNFWTPEMDRFWWKSVVLMFALCIPFQVYSMIRFIQEVRERPQNM